MRLKRKPKEFKSVYLDYTLFSKCLAEFIGTWALVFCGTGAIVVSESTLSGISHLGVSITFGLIIMVMIFAFGEISGAHFNPAVTLAFFFAKRLCFKAVIPYILAQISGAMWGSSLLKMIFPTHPTLGATMPAAISSLGNLLENNLCGAWGTSFLLEVILSFFLMSVILNVSTGSKEIGAWAGVSIGGMVLVAALFAGPISGASMNPARSIAPALLSGNTDFLSLYIFAPIIGTCLGVLGCRLTGCRLTRVKIKDKNCSAETAS